MGIGSQFCLVLVMYMAMGHISPPREEVTVMREVIKLAPPDLSLLTLPFMTRLVPIHKGTKENGLHKTFLVFSN